MRRRGGDSSFFEHETAVQLAHVIYKKLNYNKYRAFGVAGVSHLFFHRHW